MSERRIYAHWLDPDYLGRYVLPEDRISTRTSEFEGFLKLHALAGDCIHISDVQPIESRVLLHCFADPEFRFFINQHPDFLHLIAQPTDRFAAKSDRLARICKGLARIVEFGDSYIPNTFDSASLVPTVANHFVGIATEGDAEALFHQRGALTQFVANYKGADLVLVEGLYYALKHFILNPQAPVPTFTPTEAVSYHHELENALENIPVADAGHRQQIAETLDLAKSEQEKFRRSLILAKLQHTNVVGHPDRLKYLLCVQAWNVAVGQAMHADCHSAYPFRGILPIPVHCGLSRGRATFNVRISQEDETLSTLPFYEWQPSEIPWRVVSRIRHEYQNEIAQYQGSLASLEAPLGKTSSGAIEANFASLAKVAAKVIAESDCHWPKIPNVVSQTCTVACFTGGVIASVVFRHPLPAIAGGAPGPALAAYSIVREAVVSRDAKLISEALQQFGLQYNLHRVSDDVAANA